MKILIESGDGGRTSKNLIKELSNKTPNEKLIDKLKNKEGEKPVSSNDKIALRVLSLVYLIHLFIFSYASSLKGNK